MDMETGYGIRKLHPIHVKTPNLLSTFEGWYGNLLSLLEIEVQPDTLSALMQYYDPLSDASPLAKSLACL
ncbi:hypothetical protein CR513_36207, partial [Mucuna pruriens]